MKVNKFKYAHNSPISDFWIEAAKHVSAHMSPLELSNDPMLQDRQIWREVERVCSRFGYDVHYWPENLIIVPAGRGANSRGK
jgi:hypothetical protein